MPSLLSKLTTRVADDLCDGSARKLIAGWWYGILVLSFIITLLSLWTASTRSAGEGFISVWASFVILGLSIGGTMVMRKYHNSVAVGIFMGSVVAASQFFFFISLIFWGYTYDRSVLFLSSGDEVATAMFSTIQAILLAMFATFLGAHRSEIIERTNNISIANSSAFVNSGNSVATTPSTSASVNLKSQEPSYNPPKM